MGKLRLLLQDMSLKIFFKSKNIVLSLNSMIITKLSEKIVIGKYILLNTIKNILCLNTDNDNHILNSVNQYIPLSPAS